MIKYKATLRLRVDCLDRSRIEEMEIIKETDKFYTVNIVGKNGDFNFKEQKDCHDASKEYHYFGTEKEAKDWLVKKLKEKLYAIKTTIQELEQQ